MAHEDSLNQPLQFVRGVGPDRAPLLERMGLFTVTDLLLLVPRSVLDLSQVVPPWKLEADQLQTVFGVITGVDARTLSARRSLQSVLINCEGHFVRGIWFNQNWVPRRYHADQWILMSGKPKHRDGRWEFTHPQIQIMDGATDEPVGSVLPIYPLTEGLKMHEMRRIAQTVVDEYLDLLPDPVPETTREALQMLPRRQAVRQLHCPETAEQFQQARERMVLEDLLEFQLGVALRRRFWDRDAAAPEITTSARINARIRRLFPFRLTPGQDQAIQQIVTDLRSQRPMHRLVQADVGAGKTAVAIYAMLATVANQQQAVLMAPTEVLAQQHWQTIDELLMDSRVDRALLTGQLTTTQRRETLERIRSGQTQLVVGTQAVIQQDVEFSQLGLAVIDEQHKFGVAQRAHFAGSNQHPHVLVMTATPIPRSLCLTQFGDLDISVIRDLPAGRQPVVTNRVTSPSIRRRMWDFLRQQLDHGRQAYIVCPRVQTDEDNPEAPRAAEQLYESLQASELHDYRVGLVHGQLDRERRQQTMDSFRDGELDALVATTVIEVGVDVPNATLMVIHDAERFGLSQLHQLRGRIGRGEYQGYCFLLPGQETEEAERRLSVLERTCDGFEIAEADFEIRGPGDVLGTRQHGRLPLRSADLIRDAELLQRARDAALEIVRSGQFDQPEFAALKRIVLDRFGDLMDLQRTG